MLDALSTSPDPGARIAVLEALLAERDADLAAARAEIGARDLLIETLRVQIARLRRMSFGKSSERLDREIAQLELALEELEAAAAASDHPRAEMSKPDRPAPVRSWPSHLPREEIVHEPVSGACTCPSCGGRLRRLSADSDEMLDVVPVHWRVVRHVRPKYSCRACETIVQAVAPVKAVARGKATFATLAHVVVSKFDHHLPLYRQAEMMETQGIDIDRSTLAGWAGQTAALLDPIVSRIRDVGLRADKIHADDTPVPVLDPGRGRTATGRLWTYAIDDRASGATTPPLVWYEFTPDRGGVHPQRQLAGFKGCLQADAYAGYDKLYAGGVTEVACWAHFRRKIFDIHATKPTALTTDLLARIGGLYAIEAEVRGLPPDQRRSARRTRPNQRSTRCAPCSTRRFAASRPSPRWQKLVATAPSAGPRCCASSMTGGSRSTTISPKIDNNIAERALRGVATTDS